jgi:hypothetical protein
MTAPITGLDVLATAEAQLQKLFVVLQQKELAIPAESRPDNIKCVYDMETLKATFTAENVPIEVVVAGNGNITITATSYGSLD